jgi:hypothetical protein
MPNWSKVASRPVVERIAWFSGGNVRRFFALMRSLALQLGLNGSNAAAESLDDPAVVQTISEAAQPLQWLNAQDLYWLKIFRDEPSPAAKIEKLEEHLQPIIRLFDNQLVLNYQNGEMWYQVPPLIRERVTIPD